MNEWISIDFGTYSSVASVLVDRKPMVVKSSEVVFFPTEVCVVSSESVKVCDDAQQYRTIYPEFFESGFKHRIHEPAMINGVGYNTILTKIIEHIKVFAESIYEDASFTNAVLTIPARYNSADSRFNVMRCAAESAGFKTVEVLSESIAATMYYCSLVKACKGNVLVYDIGLDSFNAAVVNITQEGSFVQLADTFCDGCGGAFFDEVIYLSAVRWAEEIGSSLNEDRQIDDMETCRQMKESLAYHDEAHSQMSNGNEFMISREQFDNMSCRLLDKTFDAIDCMLSSASIKHNELTCVLLVGGSTLLPIISKRLKRHFYAYGATNVQIVHNLAEDDGYNLENYSHKYAVALGAIVSKLPKLEICQKAFLVYEDNPYELAERVNKIGRGENQTIRLDVDNHQKFSRSHFEIYENAGSYILRNISNQCTLVGGMVIGAYGNDEIELRNGDMIVAGKLKFVFRLM